jgi:hypothetical protein
MTSTAIELAPAWVVISGPAPTKVASDMAIAQTSTTCQTPAPNNTNQRSPSATPSVTPIATSTPRRSRCPYATPRTRMAAAAAK